MWDVSLGRTASLVLRTYPFMLIRVAVYFGISAAVVVAAGGGAGIGWAFGAVGGPGGRMPGAFWGALAGFAFIVVMLWWLREYILFLVRAGHVAAFLLALDEREPVAAQGQVGQALALVQQRFREAGTLLSVERCLQGSIVSLVSVLDPVGKFLPTEARALSKPINRALGAAIGFLADVVLAKPLSARRGNVWSEARDGVVLLAQARRVTMNSALQHAAAAWAVTAIVFLLALAPASTFAQSHLSGVGPITLLFAAVFAWSFKRAIVDPFAIASMMQIYLQSIAGQRPDPAWDTALTDASEEFRELKARASGSTRSQT
jgi:hypothetical protein